MQSEFRVIEPDVFPLPQTLHILILKLKIKTCLYMFVVVDKYHNLPHEKETYHLHGNGSHFKNN